MPNETLSATTTVPAPARTVFAVLADPTSHAAIDGTGWVRESLDDGALTEAGQTFRIAMYHENHPDRNYQMTNLVLAFDPPRAISWKPGQPGADGALGFGGWVWGYQLSPVGESETEVTLSYDWSAVPQDVRGNIGFPPFPVEYLQNSLSHLAEIVVSQDAAGR